MVSKNKWIIHFRSYW